ncbi:NACHT domain protein [Dolichospermum circinale]
MLAKSCHLLLEWSIGVNFCHIIAKMDINSVISAIVKIAPATATLAIKQTQRSETVIKILQELKLDPIQPPKDFDGVYKYALVHYGVNKPEPVLKLFREKEIQGFFWDNFNSDHPSTLPKKVEDFLNWNTLGDKIRELKDIDIVKEFAEFSEVFVRVARRTMNPGQVVFLKKLEQLIESLKEKPNIMVYPYPPEFQSLITEKIKSFCGRKFVFDAFENFINTNEKGYFTVIGDAGMGKSTIAAKYVFEHKTICYFNNLQENRNIPELFLESIRQQLINRYRLTNVDKDDLSTLLVKATEKLTTNEKLIIIVDALDEVKQDRGGENILYLPKTLPDHVYFFLTRRRYEPTQERLYTERSKKEYLDLTDSKYEKENQHDIQEYIRFCLNNDPEHKAGLQTWIRNKNISPDAFVQQLAAKSENNFMYLRYVLPAIAEGKYNDLNLNQLPQGLQDYYQTHWERMKMDDKAQKMKVIILYILVEFSKPIPCKKIAAITEKDEFDVQKILDEWIEYLRKQPEDGYDCYSIYHASFLNFLKPKKELNPEKRKQLLQEVNQKIITYYENIENNHG